MIKNHTKDKKSFMDAVILSLYSKTIAKNNTRSCNIRKYGDTINWENINFPPTVQDYCMSEKNNENICLNILEESENQRFTYIYKSSLTERKDKVYLILLETNHYIYLKNIFGIHLANLSSNSNSNSNLILILI